MSELLRYSSLSNSMILLRKVISKQSAFYAWFFGDVIVLSSVGTLLMLLSPYVKKTPIWSESLF
ncbi:MAG: hypothetical protein BAJATHORv1_160002 [Candidatus Thorarchaeota archaeon]|nr:MAG: hypothetical protein BAJATHORv1_160002 [Candidatus Thorarchaeota archaeon]